MAEDAAIKAISNQIQAKEIIEMKKETKLEHVDEEEIKNNPTIKAKARHLYWACFRGHIPLIKHILENDKISPFARVMEGRSAIMASLVGKHRPMKPANNQSVKERLFSATVNNRAQVEICSREYIYEKDM